MRLAVVIGIVLLLITGARFLGVARVPIGLVPVDLSVAASVRDDSLLLTGTTTVPDGAVLDCETWHEVEESETGTGAFTAAATTTVKEGRFSCRFDVLGWPAGSVNAIVRFRPYAHEQAPNIREMFGADGDRLGGRQVVYDSDGWELEVATAVELAA